MCECGTVWYTASSLWYTKGGLWRGSTVILFLDFRFLLLYTKPGIQYLVPVPVLVGTSGTIVLVAGSSSIFFSQKTKNPTLNYMYVVQNDMYL